VSIIIAVKIERLKGLCQQKDDKLQDVSECMERFIQAAEQESKLLEEMYVQKYLNMFLVLIPTALQDVHICIFTQPNCNIIHVMSLSYIWNSTSLWHIRYISMLESWPSNQPTWYFVCQTEQLISIIFIIALCISKIHLSLHTNKCTSIIYYLKSVLIKIKIKTDFK
jgi:hypothetical protein